MTRSGKWLIGLMVACCASLSLATQVARSGSEIDLSPPANAPSAEPLEAGRADLENVPLIEILTADDPQESAPEPFGGTTGACCYDDGTCEITTQAACSGLWLGADTTCDLCPCLVPCSPSAVLEQEPCGQDTNGGCGMAIPAFEPIVPDVPVCGTIWAEGGTRDTDWYEITVPLYTMFTFTVEAEFDVICGLVETVPAGTPDCDAVQTLNPWDTAAACETATVSTILLPSGTYWFWVSSQDYYDLPCGSGNRYTAALSVEHGPLAGACCYNGGYDCVTCGEWECNDLGGEWHAYESCDTYVCEIPCTEATIDIEIRTDNYPGETTWDIRDVYTGQVVCVGGPYAQQQHLYEETCCVPWNGCYDFTIHDSYGDGICCSYGIGYYNVYYVDELVCTGGEFDSEESCVEIGDACPTTGACCVGVECIGTMAEIACHLYDGVFYPYETCLEFNCPDCNADFCVEAPYAGPMRTTCGAGNDCNLRTTEEHMYRVEIPWGGLWAFSLCGSVFDTYLFVGTTPCGQEIGYNDDSCGLQSELTAYVEAGYYYVTVEGYDACGEYVLNVTHIEHCNFQCPPDGTPEAEPDCYTNYVDSVNGGCNSVPYVFSPITCGETVCGTSGTYLYLGNSYRDTDWYRIELPAPTTLSWSICPDFPAQIYILDANQGGCDNIVVAAQDTSVQGTWASCTAAVGPGEYWLFVAPNVYNGVPCGAQYVATIYADPDVCICGDFDADGDVDVDDFYFFLDAYGTCAGDVKYRDECDFDHDQCITLVDYQHWMECYRE